MLATFNEGECLFGLGLQILAGMVVVYAGDVTTESALASVFLLARTGLEG